MEPHARLPSLTVAVWRLCDTSVGRLPLVDAARHDVLVAVARGAGVRKASDHFFTAVALHGINPIGHVVGFDAENLPALGQPDLAAAASNRAKTPRKGSSSGASMTQPMCGSSVLP